MIRIFFFKQSQIEFPGFNFFFVGSFKSYSHKLKERERDGQLESGRYTCHYAKRKQDKQVNVWLWISLCLHILFFPTWLQRTLNWLSHLVLVLWSRLCSFEYLNSYLGFFQGEFKGLFVISNKNSTLANWLKLETSRSSRKKPGRLSSIYTAESGVHSARLPNCLLQTNIGFSPPQSWRRRKQMRNKNSSRSTRLNKRQSYMYFNSY